MANGGNSKIDMIRQVADIPERMGWEARVHRPYTAECMNTYAYLPLPGDHATHAPYFGEGTRIGRGNQDLPRTHRDNINNKSDVSEI